MKKRSLVYLLGGILLLSPAVAIGATVILEEENKPAITRGDVDSDLYVGGNLVSVTHDVRDDLFAGGNTVEVEGNIGQDIYAGGETVRVKGVIGDDLFAGGNTVSVNVSSVDDVFVGGNFVEITSDVIRGSVFAGGQKVNLRGDIKGSVKIGAEVINIKSGTKIDGDLITVGNKEPNIEDGVQINGERRHSLVATQKESREEKNLIIEWVFSVLVWFVVALALVYLSPDIAKDVINTALTKGAKSIGIGFLWVAALIPAMILLLISMVGWPLAIMLGLFSAGDLMIAIAFSGVVVGVWAMKRFGKKDSEIKWQHVLLGVVIMRVISVIPVFGGLVSIVVVLLTLGALGMVLWGRLKTNKTTVTEPMEVK